MKTKNCECCGGNYATGKDYGSAWHQVPTKVDGEYTFKGLCELCNVNNTTWYVNNKKCHQLT